MSNTKYTNDEGEVIIPFVKGLLYPFYQILKYKQKFLLLIASLAFFNVFCSYVLGHNFLCGLGIENYTYYCSNNLVSFVFSVLLNLACLSVFITNWYNVSECNGNISFVFGRKELKSILFMLFYITCWGCLSWFVYILMARIPVPDWRKELFIFFVMSLAILLVIYLLLHSFLFIRCLEEKKWTCFKTVFWPVFDNLYKPLGWFFVYFLFFLLIFRQSLFYFVKNEVFPVWFNALVGDFVLYAIIYVIASVFVSIFSFQVRYIFSEKN